MIIMIKCSGRGQNSAKILPTDHYFGANRSARRDLADSGYEAPEVLYCTKQDSSVMGRVRYGTRPVREISNLHTR